MRRLFGILSGAMKLCFRWGVVMRPCFLPVHSILLDLKMSVVRDLEWCLHPNLLPISWVITDKDIMEILKRNGTNIIFSNGLRDPLSSEGILESLSETIVAITTDQDYQAHTDKM